jgi:hypothetical protein
MPKAQGSVLQYVYISLTLSAYAEDQGLWPWVNALIFAESNMSRGLCAPADFAACG